jgi:uncharacterized membrane protein (DUF485 family)
MNHGSNTDWGEDTTAQSKARLGIFFFIFYALVYIGFVAIAVVNVNIMDMKIVFGLNLAIVYGFGLIIFALIMALIYNYICAKKEAAALAAGAGKSLSAETSEGK